MEEQPLRRVAVRVDLCVHGVELILRDPGKLDSDPDGHLVPRFVVGGPATLSARGKWGQPLKSARDTCRILRWAIEFSLRGVYCPLYARASHRGCRHARTQAR